MLRLIVLSRQSRGNPSGFHEALFERAGDRQEAVVFEGKRRFSTVWTIAASFRIIEMLRRAPCMASRGPAPMLERMSSGRELAPSADRAAIGTFCKKL